MRAVLRLLIVRGVPVRVREDDRVRGLKVDPEAARARGEEERKLFAPGGVVPVDRVLAVLPGRVPVDPAVLMLAVDHVILEDVEQTRHLREDQHARAFFFQPRQELVQEDHLPGVFDDVLAGEVRRSGLRALEQVRVVAALAQLHDHVQKPRAVAAAVHDFDVFLQRLFVVVLLHVAHGNLQDHLLLRREVLLHLRFQTTQKERPQHFMQLLHDLDVLRALLAGAEPFFELPGGAEHLGE
mmetsp:Transcript_4036/g.14085  ORF Transcript_4036/g.14085 Transcript_4036/m.14085 type:complete len:240 (+) Transcript_4036:1586-2305(+)